MGTLHFKGAIAPELCYELMYCLLAEAVTLHFLCQGNTGLKQFKR